MTYDASQFRDRRRQELTLRSGISVSVQAISIQALLMSADTSELPDFLVKQLYQQLAEGTQDKQQQARKSKSKRGGRQTAKQKAGLVIQQNEMSLENLQGLLKFNRLIVSAGLIQPKIVPDDVEPNYEVGEIWYTDLTDDDVDDICQVIYPQEEKAVKTASTFPDGSPESVGSV